MSRGKKFVIILLLLTKVWILGVMFFTGFIKTAWMTIPLLLTISFFVYCNVVIFSDLYRIIECPEAAKSLLDDLDAAKAELINKGFSPHCFTDFSEIQHKKNH